MRRPIDLTGGVSIGQPFAAQGFDYAQYGLKGHHGVDYPAPVGRPVYAPENGRIEKSANGVTDKYTGRFAAGETVTLVGKYEHWLMHLSRRVVGVGQQVKEGQLVGYSGNTGVSTGPHLHWGVRPLKPNLNNGYRGFVDPATVLNKPPAPTPTPPVSGGGNKVFENDKEVQEAYLMLRGNPGTAAERRHWIGKPKQQFFQVGKKEADATRAALKSANETIKKLKEQKPPASGSAATPDQVAGGKVVEALRSVL